MRDETLPPGFGERWVHMMFEAFLDRAGALADLDRLAGDGDFGANITAALNRARKNIDTDRPGSYTGLLTAVSRGFLGTGGTSGPLFGMFFRELARCTTNPEPTAAEFSRGLSAGLATVVRYGEAEVGHKTMVDALAPAAETLAARIGSGGAAAESLAAAADAAVAGAANTASLVAERGRASYIGELSRGVLDPGAAAAALILQAAAAAYREDSPAIDTGWLRTTG